MFENISHFFRRMVKPEQKELGSKDAAKERLHLVLMQDRANVSADFLELMKQEIIDVIKKYIVVDESSIDVRLTNKSNDDGTNGAPALYANIPIVNIKNDMMAEKEKKFEGVDFNKEMGITEFSEEELQAKLKPLEETIPVQEVEENKTTVIENYNDTEEIVEELEPEDDDDDDVTFDDLLKVAEAAEEAEKQLENIEKENSEELGEQDSEAKKEEKLSENIAEKVEEKEEVEEKIEKETEKDEDKAEEKVEEKKEEKKKRGRKKKK